MPKQELGNERKSLDSPRRHEGYKHKLRVFIVQALKILNLFVINEAISSVVNVDADSSVG